MAAQLQLMAGQLDRLASHILASRGQKVKKDEKRRRTNGINTPVCTIYKFNVQIVFFNSKVMYKVLSRNGLTQTCSDSGAPGREARAAEHHG